MVLVVVLVWDDELCEFFKIEWYELVGDFCRGCGYCMPCPFGVDIPKNFKLWNEYAKYAFVQKTKDAYTSMKEEEKASHSQQCGKCETLCPQALTIRKDLKCLDEELTN